MCDFLVDWRTNGKGRKSGWARGQKVVKGQRSADKDLSDGAEGAGQARAG